MVRIKGNFNLGIFDGIDGLYFFLNLQREGFGHGTIRGG
jgi:hypothetical protein